ncbi:hypothetical protein L1F30_15000 [Simiduia sp. 21SJ11W-1]|uniref:hypothetical protein n=1 Tax=Simiduia sp. 21SJ11W-1 TaxID=2909669 RepID=UPI00209FA85F|nr:hypothetical protein [Simiduia sp. 21SJ11W-1]UTA47455.1 hypothetical protein L1F30_15000 [Simiduia sp. 21SJ11W-1]
MSKSRSIPTKHELALIDLLEHGTEGISKLTTLASYGETSLPTTISELGLQRGIRIDRKRCKHRHRHGGETFFTHYWLGSKSTAYQALDVLKHLRAARNAPPPIHLEKAANQFPDDELRG